MESHAFTLSMILPRGMDADDFYALVASVVVIVCAFAVWLSFQTRDNFSKQIKQIQTRREDLRKEFVGAKKRKKTEVHVSFMRMIAMKLQLVKKNQIGKTEAELVQAGLRSKDAIYVLAFFNLLLPILLCGLGIIVMNMNENISPKWKMMNYIWPVLGAYIGLKLPWYYVHKKKKNRNLAVQKSLPDVLDLMTICAEAGLSLVSMLDRVSKELKMSYP